jgi:response regulator of citrate/malate metabolism
VIIICITGTEKESLAEALDVGMDGYLVKPFTLSGLDELLENMSE